MTKKKSDRLNLLEKVVDECKLALYPNGDGSDLMATDLPTYIRQLREDRDRLKELAQDELTKCGEAQRELVSEKKSYENKLENLQMFCDMAEQRAIDLEGKIRVLTICFEGLFPMERSERKAGKG